VTPRRQGEDVVAVLVERPEDAYQVLHARLPEEQLEATPARAWRHRGGGAGAACRQRTTLH
jgi:hypothetical protein